jgi:hypothetical protein
MQLGILGWQGYGDTGWKNPARISVYADERITDTACGSHIEFSVAPIGSTVYQEKMRLNGSGLSVSNNLYVAGEVVGVTITGSNKITGAIGYTPFDLDSLANGNNAAVPVGTNALIEITTGPTGAFAICGLAAGYSGQIIWVVNLTGQNMTAAHQSGVEPTAGNRIITMTGSDVATTGNGAFKLYYSGSQSRWVLISSEP